MAFMLNSCKLDAPKAAMEKIHQVPNRFFICLNYRGVQGYGGEAATLLKEVTHERYPNDFRTAGGAIFYRRRHRGSGTPRPRATWQARQTPQMVGFGEGVGSQSCVD